MAFTNSLAQVALVVNDYDEAIRYYCDILGFKLVCDRPLSETKRWVVVSPGNGGSQLLLAKAATDEQRTRVGNQTGGRVFLFLNTDDFDAAYRAYKERGVRFTESPRIESYGKVVVFEDLYGNRWDLIEPQ